MKITVEPEDGDRIKVNDMKPLTTYYGIYDGAKAIIWCSNGCYFALTLGKIQYLTSTTPKYVDKHCNIKGECKIKEINITMIE